MEVKWEKPSASVLKYEDLGFGEVFVMTQGSRTVYIKTTEGPIALSGAGAGAGLLGSVDGLPVTPLVATLTVSEAE